MAEPKIPKWSRHKSAADHNSFSGRDPGDDKPPSDRAGRAREILINRIVAVIVIALLCLTIAHRPEKPWDPADIGPNLAAVTCWFEKPSHLIVNCFRLRVPETRDISLRTGHATVSKELTLPVVLVHARPENGYPIRPDPVIYLAGGPGSGTGIDADHIGGWWLEMEVSPWLFRRDVILFDQRGSGLVEPRMDCPDQTDFLVRQLAIVEGAEAGRQWVENARQCADSVLVAGHNPAAYTSVDSAEDIHALFEALNVPRWNVYGASYGTRLALEYMRQHPSDIRSVVLEAVSPPQARLYEDDAAHTNRAIQYLIGQCATQPACNEAYPDLGSRLQTLIERLDKEPMLITRERPDGEGQIVVPVDDERLLSRIYSMLYSYEDIRYVPRLIDAYDRKVWTEINDEVDNRIRSAGDPKDKGEAMRMSVQCFEEAPFNDFAKADAEYANYPLLRGLAQDHIWQSNKEACNVWRRIFAVDETRDSDGDAVVSDLPTLILTGTFDPITPPAYARMVARKLANSHLFEFPRSGHGVLSDSMCAREIADSFLETPDIRPSTKCHLEGDELDFAAPAQMTEGR